ncbi:hypothetical protein KZ483_05080 [Paenibacillus sp. sptzw28]|uniref:DUF5957 family protein n=1 Tax=Paenibacillus sp. sptzw28 TaxID=715179 RepID=UPI001C6F41D2|nr:DUF5957 family protein [Paenibacillus sp. sptzw28]QYR22361.1 hypothetical protein KZ483_05080 [Paenibacillus sp. sptzw28]
MKTISQTVLAIIGGFLGGFVLFELIVRTALRTLDSVPIALIGTLSMVIPFMGAVIAVWLIRRRRRS